MSVAIVMPYFNEKDLLVKSVEAIYNQTYTDWHLYLIDDGSDVLEFLWKELSNLDCL